MSIELYNKKNFFKKCVLFLKFSVRQSHIMTLSWRFLLATVPHISAVAHSLPIETQQPSAQLLSSWLSRFGATALCIVGVRLDARGIISAIYACFLCRHLLALFIFFGRCRCRRRRYRLSISVLILHSIATVRGFYSSGRFSSSFPSSSSTTTLQPYMSSTANGFILYQSRGMCGRLASW